MDHDEEGSVGFIINKPLKYTINDLLPEINALLKFIMVACRTRQSLFYHNIPELIPNSIEISNGIYWGGDFESTKALINNGKINKNNIRFFLGYTGWEENHYSWK
jgi:putative transcriptional regulator